VAETALTLCGPEGAAADGTAAGPVHDFLLTRCSTPPPTRAPGSTSGLILGTA
jgi:hypothetical protein